jgi:hypothetical protein
MFAMKPHYVMMLIFPVLMVGSDCGCREKKKKTMYDQVDGGYVTRDECWPPTDACWLECEARKASLMCGSCCRDQDFLCNTQQPHSFESCKGTR